MMPLRGLKMAKNAKFWHVFAIFKPFTGTKILPNNFCLVDEIPSFDLVGHM